MLRKGLQVCMQCCVHARWRGGIGQRSRGCKGSSRHWRARHHLGGAAHATHQRGRLPQRGPSAHAPQRQSGCGGFAERGRSHRCRDRCRDGLRDGCEVATGLPLGQHALQQTQAHLAHRSHIGHRLSACSAGSLYAALVPGPGLWHRWQVVVVHLPGGRPPQQEVAKAMHRQVMRPGIGPHGGPLERAGAPGLGQGGGGHLQLRAPIGRHIHIAVHPGHARNAGRGAALQAVGVGEPHGHHIARCGIENAPVRRRHGGAVQHLHGHGLQPQLREAAGHGQPHPQGQGHGKQGRRSGHGHPMVHSIPLTFSGRTGVSRRHHAGCAAPS